MRPARGGRSPRKGPVPGLLLALLLGYAGFLHHGFGPPSELVPPPWWAPRGFLIEWLGGTRLAPEVERPQLWLSVFLLPAFGLAAGVFASSRSTALRALALAATLATALLLYYGLWPARIVWRFFHWRGSAVMLLLAGITTLAVLSPWLTRAWLRLGWGLRLVSYAAVFLGVLALERNVTGTNPELRFAVSPWPVIPVIGLELIALVAAAEFAGIALGLIGLVRLRRRAQTPRRVFGLAGLGLGVAFPVAVLWIGSTQGFLPFHLGSATFVASGLVCAAGIACAAGVGPVRTPERLRRRASLLGTAAVLVGLPLAGGQLMVRWDYSETRDVRAERLIEALATYYEREQLFPDSLAELVATNDLEAVPPTRIGFPCLGEGEFTYQSFGSSYLLEFAAPRWVQCAYNPAYQEQQTGERLEGAWSCPSRPPELW